MVVMPCYGIITAFPHQPLAVAAWAMGVAAALAISTALKSWSDISWSEQHRSLLLPGSWVPLALFLGLFATKYITNLMLAMDPPLKFDGYFVMLAGLAYGAFSGIFLGRGVAMWKVARHALRPVPAY